MARHNKLEEGEKRPLNKSGIEKLLGIFRFEIGRAHSELQSR